VTDEDLMRAVLQLTRDLATTRKSLNALSKVRSAPAAVRR